LEFGPNELTKKKGISPWRLFLEQFKSILIIIPLIAVVLSAVVGEPIDVVIIGVIILFACGLGFIQEYRAERAMEALKRMAAPTASVLRDGNEEEVPARELVPGDVITVRTGDRIPADARLLEAVNLRTNEAPLTGRSVPTDKTTVPMQGGYEHRRPAEYGVYWDGGCLRSRHCHGDRYRNDHRIRQDRRYAARRQGRADPIADQPGPASPLSGACRSAAVMARLVPDGPVVDIPLRANRVQVVPYVPVAGPMQVCQETVKKLAPTHARLRLFGSRQVYVHHLCHQFLVLY
jgi:hypothetical protein